MNTAHEESLFLFLKIKESGFYAIHLIHAHAAFFDHF
jgi:hypothetical protein